LLAWLLLLFFLAFYVNGRADVTCSYYSSIHFIYKYPIEEVTEVAEKTNKFYFICSVSKIDSPCDQSISIILNGIESELKFLTDSKGNKVSGFIHISLWIVKIK